MGSDLSLSRLTKSYTVDFGKPVKRVISAGYLPKAGLHNKETQNSKAGLQLFFVLQTLNRLTFFSLTDAKTDYKQVGGDAFGYDARYFNPNFVLVQNWLC